jgi:hypothetical protein
VWFVTAGHRLLGPVLLGRPLPADESHPTAVAVAGSRLLLAGTDRGRVDLWTASIGPDGPGAWSPATAPPAAVNGLERMSLSSSGEGTIMALDGSSSSQLWVAPPA